MKKVQAFMQAVALEPRSGCWFWLKEDPDQARRVSYGIFVKKVPKRLNVSVKCGNDECVNPWHSFIWEQK